jgi:hypothetical protein
MKLFSMVAAPIIMGILQISCTVNKKTAAFIAFESGLYNLAFILTPSCALK